MRAGARPADSADAAPRAPLGCRGAGRGRGGDRRTGAVSAVAPADRRPPSVVLIRRCGTRALGIPRHRPSHRDGGRPPGAAVAHGCRPVGFQLVRPPGRAPDETANSASAGKPDAHARLQAETSATEKAVPRSAQSQKIPLKNFTFFGKTFKKLLKLLRFILYNNCV